MCVCVCVILVIPFSTKGGILIRVVLEKTLVSEILEKKPVKGGGSFLIGFLAHEYLSNI